MTGCIVNKKPEDAVIKGNDSFYFPADERRPIAQISQIAYLQIGAICVKICGIGGEHNPNLLRAGTLKLK